MAVDGEPVLDVHHAHCFAVQAVKRVARKLRVGTKRSVPEEVRVLTTGPELVEQHDVSVNHTDLGIELDGVTVFAHTTQEVEAKGGYPEVLDVAELELVELVIVEDLTIVGGNPAVLFEDDVGVPSTPHQVDVATVAGRRAELPCPGVGTVAGLVELNAPLEVVEEGLEAIVGRCGT